MNWKLKAKIQNIVALLPSELSYSLYYWLQRNFGALKTKNITPVPGLSSGFEFCSRLMRLNRSPINATFFEIGTGRRLNVPIALWLAGAKKVITLDLNPYLKSELVKQELGYIRANTAQIQSLFAGQIYDNRLEKLLDFSGNNWQLPELLNFCGIDYLAPADAAMTALPANSVDYHISYNVFEHISPANLRKILKEAGRIIKPDGMLIHRIDYSDHFAYADETISKINFLQFTDKQWQKIASNRYMYANRLRIDDFENLFDCAGYTIISNTPQTDPRSSELIEKSALALAQPFASKPKQSLTAIASWVISRKN